MSLLALGLRVSRFNDNFVCGKIKSPPKKWNVEYNLTRF